MDNHSTPPPTPPRVAFDPPLFLQRRTAIFDLVTALHKLPRFEGKLRSLLDVGCGAECLLLGSLIPPNDNIPLEQITGIDVDDGLWDDDLVNNLGPGGVHVGDIGRWRRLSLTLLHGSFEVLSLGNLAHHDVIVSAEVIEHLDPGPLENFSKVLLGRLKPKICIVTTPNRDFNDLFTLPFTPEGSGPTTPGNEGTDAVVLGDIVDLENFTPVEAPPTLKPDPHAEALSRLAPGDVCSSGDRYWRHGVPYGMRHPDHRFEWTRGEFREWANKAAEEYGYDVSFTGVGGLGNGMCVVGSTGFAVGEALAKGCGYDRATEYDKFAQDRGVLEKADEVWGDCTQIAVFTIQEDEEQAAEGLINIQDWSRRRSVAQQRDKTTSPLNPYIFPPVVTQVVHHDFPYDDSEMFPPSYLTVVELLEKQMLTYLPTLVVEEWSKSPHQLTRDRLKRLQNPGGAGASSTFYRKEEYDSDSECDYAWNPEVDGDEDARKVRRKERRYEKRIKRGVEEAVLGGKRVDLIKVVKVSGVGLKSLWDGGYGGKGGLKRLCRYRPEVFRRVLMEGWKAIVGENLIGDKARGHCQPIIDTAGIYQYHTDGEGLCDLYDWEDPTRRRKLSVSRGISESATSSISPQKLQQQQQSSSALSLATLNLTSDVCTSPSSSGWPGLGQEASRLREQAISTSQNPIFTTEVLSLPETLTTSKGLPHRAQVVPALLAPPHPDNDPPHSQRLPIQLESDTKMVVKIYAAAATRSVIDLIRRDLSDGDRDVLKKWRIVKVEYNSCGSQDTLKEGIKEVTEEEEEGGAEPAAWEIANENEPYEAAWEDSMTKAWIIGESGAPAFGVVGAVDTYDSWGGNDNTGLVPHTIELSNDGVVPKEDTYTPNSNDNPFQDDSISEAALSATTNPFSLNYHVDDPYGDDADPSPWADDTTKAFTMPKLHTELIYTLDNVDTHLSIDTKGKKPQTSLPPPNPFLLPRSKNPRESELKSFMTANQALFESGDSGVLSVDWSEYVKSRERVGRWMDERRRMVQDWNQQIIAKGIPEPGKGKWRADERRLKEWERWVEEQDANDATPGLGLGKNKLDGEQQQDEEDALIGIVFYKPGAGGIGGVEDLEEAEEVRRPDIEDESGWAEPVQPDTLDVRRGSVLGLGLQFENWKGF